MVYAMKSVSVRQSASHDDVRTRRHDCTVLVSISKLAITTSTRSSSSSSSNQRLQLITPLPVDRTLTLSCYNQRGFTYILTDGAGFRAAD